jgi:ABC-type multidrug transport system ATPase subunit
VLAIDVHRSSPNLKPARRLVVAHRLSTIREADHIYVLHQGRVVEEGTHRSLLGRSGRYAQLVNAQSDAQALAPCQCRAETQGEAVLSAA